MKSLLHPENLEPIWPGRDLDVVIGSMGLPRKSPERPRSPQGNANII